MEISEPAPGFFGKIISQADFVARRVPPEVRQKWDLWLQEGIHDGRRHLSGQWLDIYLQSPLWRFALAPAVCGEHALGGVLMPSIDSVGRQFPLTLIARLPPDMGIFRCMRDAQSWYAYLEMVALASLNADFQVDDLERALCAAPPILTHAGGAVAAVGQDYRLALDGLSGLPASAAALAVQLADLGLQGKSLWWTEGSQKVAPSLLLCDGMPGAEKFRAMLDGEWHSAGWQARTW